MMLMTPGVSGLVAHSSIPFGAAFEFLHKQVIWEIILGKANKEVSG